MNVTAYAANTLQKTLTILAILIGLVAATKWLTWLTWQTSYAMSEAIAYTLIVAFVFAPVYVIEYLR